jgi:hypothetical protein
VVEKELLKARERGTFKASKPSWRNFDLGAQDSSARQGDSTIVTDYEDEV